MVEVNSGLVTTSRRSERPFVRAIYSNSKNVKLCKRSRLADAIFILKSFPPSGTMSSLEINPLKQLKSASGCH